MNKDEIRVSLRGVILSLRGTPKQSYLDCRASYKVRWLAMTKGVILNSRLNDTFGQVFQDLRFRIKSGMTTGRGLPPEAGRRNDTKIKYQ